METLVVGFIAFMGALWLVTALHELGHVLTGGAIGLQIHPVNVMGLSLRRDEGGWRIVVGSLSGAGGFAAFVPPVPAPPDLRRTFALLTAAGPLANLLFGLATVPALRQVAGSPFAAHDGITLLAALFSALSLLTAVTNAIPLRLQGMLTDGGQLIELLRHPRQVETLVERLRLSMLILSSRGPEDLTPEDIAWLAPRIQQSAADEPSAGLRLGATYALAAHELVSGRPASAQNVILLASWP